MDDWREDGVGCLRVGEIREAVRRMGGWGAEWARGDQQRGAGVWRRSLWSSGEGRTGQSRGGEGSTRGPRVWVPGEGSLGVVGVVSVRWRSLCVRKTKGARRGASSGSPELGESPGFCPWPWKVARRWWQVSRGSWIPFSSVSLTCP